MSVLFILYVTIIVHELYYFVLNGETVSINDFMPCLGIRIKNKTRLNFIFFSLMPLSLMFSNIFFDLVMLILFSIYLSSKSFQLPLSVSPLLK